MKTQTLVRILVALLIAGLIGGASIIVAQNGRGDRSETNEVTGLLH
jgi:hypothetical protein